MKMRIYAIRDCKADYFNNPIALRTDMEAQRAFVEACAPGQDTMISRYPEDYVLAHIAEFDNSNGLVESMDTPAVIMTGIDAALVYKRRNSNGNASALGDETRLLADSERRDSQEQVQSQ